MPAPGASTASALVVCVASLSGWCLWQQNCGEDDLVGPPALQILEKGGMPQPMQEAYEAKVTGASVQTQAPTFGNHSFQASLMVVNEQCSKNALSRGVVDIASSSHVSMEKAFEFFAVANLSLDKLYPSRFTDFEEIVSPLSMKLRTLERDQPHSVVTIAHMHQQATILGTSSLMHLLGYALVLDMVACGLVFVCAMAAWHGRSHKSPTPVAQDSHEAARPFVKPVFVQPPVPSHCDGAEPIFQQSPVAVNLDGPQDQVPVIAIDGLHAASVSSDADLKARINAIVGSHAEHRKQCEEYSFQWHASMALSAAQERQQKMHANASQLMDYLELQCSPSPAKSMSNIELTYCAHVALSAAKERTTPAKSPTTLLDAYHENDVAPCQLKLDAYHENDVVSRQLSFADDADTLAAQKDEQQVKTAGAELEELATETTEEELAAELARTATAELVACLSESDGAAIALSATAEKLVDAKKAQALPFDVKQIPSPTRNRALKKQLFAASSSAADAEGSELTKKLQSRRNVVDSEGTTWQKLPEVALTDASNIDGGNSASEKAKPSWKEIAGSQRDFSSPGRGGAVGRMLQSSATPQKQNGEKLQGGRRSLPHGTTHREKEVATHRAAAFEAWGVSSPAPAPRTEAFKYQ